VDLGAEMDDCSDYHNIWTPDFNHIPLLPRAWTFFFL